MSPFHLGAAAQTAPQELGGEEATRLSGHYWEALHEARRLPTATPTGRRLPPEHTAGSPPLFFPSPPHLHLLHPLMALALAVGPAYSPPEFRCATFCEFGSIHGAGCLLRAGTDHLLGF